MWLPSRIPAFHRTINAGVRDGLHHVKRFSWSHMNFILREMSLVGPCLTLNERQVNDNGGELPDEQISGFVEPLRVRLGLTGIAQIWAPRGVPRRQVQVRPVLSQEAELLVGSQAYRLIILHYVSGTVGGAGEVLGRYRFCPLL
jgi:hypothetical protein